MSLGRARGAFVDEVAEVLVDLRTGRRSSPPSARRRRRVRSRPIFSGCRIPSRMRRNMRISSSGRPIRPRNTDDGNSSANSSLKLHSPRSMNESMKPFTRRVMSSSCSSMRRRREQGVEELPVLRVHRRVDVQRDHRPDVAEVHVDDRREFFVVAQHVLGVRTREAQRHPRHRLDEAALGDQVEVALLRRGEVEHRPHRHLRVRAGGRRRRRSRPSSFPSWQSP